MAERQNLVSRVCMLLLRYLAQKLARQDSILLLIPGGRAIILNHLAEGPRAERDD